VSYGVCVETWISAALRIEGSPTGSRLHGHDYRIRACAEAEDLEGKPYVIDHYELLSVLRSCASLYDHQSLNDVIGDSAPSAEKLARLVFSCVEKSLPDRARLVIVEVCTATGMCSYYRVAGCLNSIRG
jgi:6-pyruvoyltetrahydropterin/6-carboxytetrahydropterin synthase